MSDAEIRDELLTLLVAGHETTATALSWAVERLARHPEKLERLRAEALAGDERLPDRDDPGDAAPAPGDRRRDPPTDRAGRARRLRAPRRRLRRRPASTWSTATPRSTPNRTASCPSASSTTRPAPTPGSPSAAASAAASAPPSPSSRWPSSSASWSNATSIRPGRPEVRAPLPPRHHRDPAARRRGHSRLIRSLAVQVSLYRYRREVRRSGPAIGRPMARPSSPLCDRDYMGLTPAQRTEQVFELSRFMSQLAEAGRRQRRG